ncbi:MAG TPA: MarR family transcriptional regulator [Candidatus Thermoplasmatota archaeon]|nr:MarR family transcriptional regulator [Candidatus Thermoplasmatota archaeon]
MGGKVLQGVVVALVVAVLAAAPALAALPAVNTAVDAEVRTTSLLELSGGMCPEGGARKAGCLVGWDRGAEPGPGDDAVNVGVLVRVAPGALVAPVAPQGAMAAIHGPAADVADAWVAADQDPDEMARALLGKLEPLRAASPVHGPDYAAEGKSTDGADMVTFFEGQWYDLFPSLDLAAGVTDLPGGAEAALEGAGADAGAGAAREAFELPRSVLRPADAGGAAPYSTLARAPEAFAPSVAGAAPGPSPSVAGALRDALAAAPQAAFVGGAALGASLAFAWGLYTRIAAHRALDQGTRRRIYDLVAGQPGVRVGTLRRQLELSYPAVERHVRMLVHFGLLEVHPGGQRRLFVRGSADADGRAAVVASSTPQARRVLDHLRTRGPVTMGALRAELGLPRSSASLVVQRLSAAGLVVARPEGRRLLVALPSQLPAPEQVALAPAPPALQPPSLAPALAR